MKSLPEIDPRISASDLNEVEGSEIGDTAFVMTAEREAEQMKKEELIENVVEENVVALGEQACDEMDEKQDFTVVENGEENKSLVDECERKCEKIDSISEESSVDVALITNTTAANEKNDGNGDSEWCIDSGASNHMTFDIELLSNVVHNKDPSPVYLGDNSAVLSHAQGELRLKTECPNGRCLALSNVLYVPKLAKNLLSVRSMTRNGAEVTFKGDQCIVSKNGKSAVIGRSKNNGLYKFQSPTLTHDAMNHDAMDHAYISTSATMPSLTLWHQRYGHLNMNDINKLFKSDLVIGMKAKMKNQIDAAENCESCALGKMHRLPYPKQTQHRSKNILEMIHTDLCGPMQVDSIGGSRYILTFTDDFSRYSVVYFLKQKSEVFSKFLEYVKLVENNSDNYQIKNLNIQAVRSDNGGEYLSDRFTKYCNEKGIARQFTNPYCPEQNGVAERLNRTIVEGARSILYGAKLPLRFWAEAVSTVVYLRNRSPTSSLKGLTPFECWFKEKPDVSNL